MKYIMRVAIVIKEQTQKICRYEEFNYTCLVNIDLNVQIQFVPLDSRILMGRLKEELDSFDIIICHGSLTKYEYYMIKNDHNQRYYDRTFYIPMFPYKITPTLNSEIDAIMQDVNNNKLLNSVIDFTTRKICDEREYRLYSTENNKRDILPELLLLIACIEIILVYIYTQLVSV